MALIKCPECKKEISNKATVCIHCGYPLQEIQKRDHVVLNTKASIYFLIRLINYYDKEARANYLICKITGLTLPEASVLVDKNYSPILIAGLSMEDAEKIKSIFKESGIHVGVEPDNESTQKTLFNIGKNDILEAINYSIPKQDDNNFLFCRKCRSKMIDTVSVTTLTSWSEPMNVCQACGYKWKPGK